MQGKTLNVFGKKWNFVLGKFIYIKLHEMITRKIQLQGDLTFFNCQYPL